MPEPELIDPYLWLEEVQGERALAWVRERNAESQQLLQAQPEYEPTRAALLEMLDSKARIPQISRRGDYFYNLWQDESHKRGLWRRTSLIEYKKAEPAWETVLDLDELSATEGENWTWGGAVGLPPSHSRCLVALSRGGADAAVVREFDTVVKRFVSDGFTLPEAKSDVEWIDADTIFVGTDFGPGSMTESGYPRIIKRWSRGTPLTDATTVFEVDASDLSAGVSVDHTPGFERTLLVQSVDFYSRRYFMFEGAQARSLGQTPLDPRSPAAALDVPGDASIAFWNSAGAAADILLIELRSALQSNGRTYASGSLLATDAKAYLAGERRFDVLFTPTTTRSLAGFTTTRSHVIVNVLDNVASRLEEWRHTPAGLQMREVSAPFPGTLVAGALHDPMRSDDALAEHYLLSYADFLTPDSLWLAHTASDAREQLKSLPARFDSEGMHAQQFFATSADGTRVPYFVVWPRGVSIERPADGSTPALLYGYGGFEISMQPWYPAGYGSAWLARSGALIVANIRGGGEYGPPWHQAALKANKQRSYDDFIAVAEDLISRRITSPKQLAIQGGSNGGLLVGAVFAQRPDLFNAVVCSVPLLDMRRYHRLLAGASWMAEYGDPDNPAEWAFISKYSPYHRIHAGVRYPEVLFTTSTRDDRVHPAHARKMAARMLDQGHPVLYYENIEGGHGGAADNAQRAHLQALEMAYLWKQTREPPISLEAQSVIDYWFGTPGSAECGKQREMWFRKSDATDQEIARRFGPLIERALRGELEAWADRPESAVAQILLLDQFTRNTMRNTPRAFVGDERALKAAIAMVASGQDQALRPEQRTFVYLPFEHCEDQAMQDESIRLFSRLAADAPALGNIVEYAEKHRAIVRRFGRFPHRNEILRRQSTPEEVAFLREPGSRF